MLFNRKYYLLSILAGLIYSVVAQDNYPNKVPIDSSYGYGFTAEYFNTYKVITNTMTNQRYALVCCGQSTNLTGYNAVITTPLKTVGIDAELEVLPFFELLNLSSIVLSAKPSLNVTSPCYKGIGDSPSDPSSSIEAVFTSIGTNADPNAAPHYISFSAGSHELTPLQQSAWILYTSYFFDLESNANDIYEEIKLFYNCHKQNLQDSGTKNIAWTRYDIVSKSWSLRFDNFLNELIRDAGMSLVHENRKTVTYTDLDQFHLALQTADYVIDDSDPENFKADFAYGDWLKAAGFNISSTAYSFITGLNVYRTDKLISEGGYSDWPIRHPARADLVISDIIHMVYSTYEPTYNTTWLREFAHSSNPEFVSDVSYPSCTNPALRLKTDVCTFSPFKPDKTVDLTEPKKSTETIKTGLSTAGKIGVAVGVFVGVATTIVVGFFAAKRLKRKPVEGNFYRMNDV